MTQPVHLQLIKSIKENAKENPLDPSQFPHAKATPNCEGRVVGALVEKKKKHCGYANGITRAELKKDIRKLYHKDYDEPSCARKFERSLQNLARRGEIKLEGELIVLQERGEMLFQVLQQVNPGIFHISKSPNITPPVKKKEKEKMQA